MPVTPRIRYGFETTLKVSRFGSFPSVTLFDLKDQLKDHISVIGIVVVSRFGKVGGEMCELQREGSLA